MKKDLYYILSLIIFIVLTSCSNNKSFKDEKNEFAINNDTKIVSLNGTITEIICKAGFEKNLVAVDATSNYPESIKKLPNLGFIRSINLEAVLAYNPDIIIGIEEQLNTDLINKLKNSGKKIWLFKHQYTVSGAKELIKQVCDSLNKNGIVDEINNHISEQINKIKLFNIQPKVLFIYARGAGTIMAAGINTQMDEMIRLAGAKNAITEFENFKPLSPEILAKSNPDIILMFDMGLESLEGEDGLLSMPGVKNTNAGKNKAFIAMDGQYLSGFGPRLGDAVLELNTKIHEQITKLK